MGLFYLLHEYTNRYYPDFSLGKKFARITILGFILYYIAYFIAPLYFTNYADRIQHFIIRLAIVDVIASSIFYGGFFNSVSLWTTGKAARPDLELEVLDTQNAINADNNCFESHEPLQPHEPPEIFDRMNGPVSPVSLNPINYEEIQ